MFFESLIFHWSRKYSGMIRSRIVQDSVLAGSGNFWGNVTRSLSSSGAVNIKSVNRFPRRFAALHSFSVSLTTVLGDFYAFGLILAP